MSALSRVVVNLFNSRTVGTMTSFAPELLLLVMSDTKAAMGSILGGNKWKVASELLLAIVLIGPMASAFSAVATRGGIALRITSYGEPPQ